MNLEITSRDDLRNGQLWWRLAFSLLWFAGVVLAVGDTSSSLQIFLLFLAPIATLFLGRLVPSIPYDFQGMLFVGTLACSLLAPGFLSTLEYKAAGYTTLTRIVDLSELAVVIVIGMLMGFFSGRSVVKWRRSRGQ